jgi:hypothetical protein
MKTVTTPQLENALNALEQAINEYCAATAHCARGDGQRGRPNAVCDRRDCQALILGQPNKKWVRPNRQLRKHSGGT